MDSDENFVFWHDKITQLSLQYMQDVDVQRQVSGKRVTKYVQRVVCPKSSVSPVDSRQKRFSMLVK